MSKIFHIFNAVILFYFRFEGKIAATNSFQLLVSQIKNKYAPPLIQKSWFEALTIFCKMTVIKNNKHASLLSHLVCNFWVKRGWFHTNWNLALWGLACLTICIFAPQLQNRMWKKRMKRREKGEGKGREKTLFTGPSVIANKDHVKI